MIEQEEQKAHTAAAAAAAADAPKQTQTKRTSKMLLPIDDDTAMSPSPLFATITDESRSGTEVPAARRVSPSTGRGMPRASPKISAASTIRKEKMAIQAMDMKKLTKQRERQEQPRQGHLVPTLRVSGMVKYL